MAQRSMAELIEEARRLREEGHMLVERAKMVAAECRRIRESGASMRVHRGFREPWEAFIDRYAEAVLRDLPHEYPGE